MEICGTILQLIKNLSSDNSASKIDLTLRLGLPCYHKQNQINKGASEITFSKSPENYTTQCAQVNAHLKFNIIENGILSSKSRGQCSNDNKCNTVEAIPNNNSLLIQPPSKSSLNDGNRARSRRSCKKCGTTKTPLWRRGPDGPQTFCNACGLHYARFLRKDLLKAQKRQEMHQARRENSMAIKLC